MLYDPRWEPDKPPSRKPPRRPRSRLLPASIPFLMLGAVGIALTDHPLLLFLPFFILAAACLMEHLLDLRR